MSQHFLLLIWTPVILFGAIFLFQVFFMGSRSNFQTREFEKGKSNKKSTSPKVLQQPTNEQPSKSSAPKGPLLLEGFTLHREAHLILGIREDATESQIKTAYKTLMKRFHPDKVGSPGSREWKDAQSIAQEITEAKNKMLESVMKKSRHKKQA